MSIITDLIEIVVSIILIGIVAKYITFILGLVGIMLPPIINWFFILGITISKVQYIIARKDD